eukprot:g32128.t1
MSPRTRQTLGPQRSASGQQGEGPLPARLWRVRLSDMQLLGFVFVQFSSFTDPNQIPLFEINQLTALGSGGSIWVAGDRLLFRLDIATLRSRDYLDLPASWGQVTVITEYGEVLVPQLLVLPARLTVTLGGAGITALAPVASGVVAATGEDGSQPAALHLVELPANLCENETAEDPTTRGSAWRTRTRDLSNSSEDCSWPTLVANLWQAASVEINSLVSEGNQLHAAVMEGGTLNPRASTLDFTENATTVAQGEGRLMLTKVPGTLYGLLLPPTGASRFSALTRDADFAPLGFALVSIFGRRVAGPIEVGYLATSDTGGLSSPSAVAYAALPEPCLYVVDTGNHRLLQLEVQGLRYRTHFGERRTPSRAPNAEPCAAEALQSLSLPFAATALTLLPGAGLGVARLWAGGRGARRLARWDLTPPGFWAVSGTSTAQAGFWGGFQKAWLKGFGSGPY